MHDLLSAQQLRQAAQTGARFTYYGGMAVLVERWDGYKIFFDPFLTGNRLTQAQPSDFFDVDLLVVTHAAFDHLGDTALLLKNSRAQVICGWELKHLFMDEEGIAEERILNTGYGDSRVVGGHTLIRSVFAQHGSFCQVEGSWACWPPYGFIACIQPGITYYHTGDTYLYSDMKMLRQLYHPEVMVAGISAVEEQYAREMTPREAALAVSWAGARVTIPAHYPPGSPDLAEFVRHMGSFAPDTIIKQEIGVPFTCRPFTVE